MFLSADIQSVGTLQAVRATLVARQLVDHLNTANLLPELQSAYRAYCDVLRLDVEYC